MVSRTGKDRDISESLIDDPESDALAASAAVEISR
jgi:hypothetical protein